MDKLQTRFPGVRIRKHKTRKHGVRFDECYFIRRRVDGRLVEECAGWASEGMSAEKAFTLLGELKENARTGSGPRTLAEMREAGEVQRQDEARERQEEALREVTFRAFADEQYFPITEPGWKPETARKHKEHCATWLYPHLGDKPLRRIGMVDVNKVRAAMMQAGRSPRTMQAVFRTFSMVWTAARDAELVTVKAPTRKGSFRLPKIDNERQRYLAADEAERLMACVRARSAQAADMALVSLESGLRFGEVAALTWGCLDLEKRVLMALNTKGKRDRIVPMTAKLHDLLGGMEPGGASDLVFPTRLGTKHQQVPSTFKRGLDDSKLNEGVTEPKMRASFHTLRHTFASRMVQQGVDLYHLQRILGHSTPALTARYAKLADGDLRAAVDQMERRERMKAKQPGKIVPMRKTNGA